MASGKTHDIVTAYTGHVVWFVGVITTCAEGSRDALYPAAITAGYLIGGWLLSPDLDCYPAVSNPLKRWGWFRVIWFPYRKAVKHRSWISHTYVVGVTLQLIYLALMLLLIYCVLFGLLSVVVSLPTPKDALVWGFGLIESNSAIFLSLWIGLIMGSASHLVLDGIGLKK
ncbi:MULTISPECIES: DUF2227 family putative metal-binding protein [Cyanophyceae]|uniref:DUF2227 family putative metal-binding protein n=1 Tax=Cyanophyceae TaxID=3028117 RepID=UPI00168512F2|nr:metal-binding protein [Trichocoleus sp. FACHB-40]